MFTGLGLFLNTSLVSPSDKDLQSKLELKEVIKKIKEIHKERIEVIALGTNAIATAQMLKARANRGASGENAIVQTVRSVDVIIGPIGIVIAHAMMGEVTPGIAEAVAASPAEKFLIPLSQENVKIIGITEQPLPHLIEELIESRLNKIIQNNKLASKNELNIFSNHSEVKNIFRSKFGLQENFLINPLETVFF